MRHTYGARAQSPEPQRPSPRAAATEARAACALQQEKPVQREALTPQLESSLRSNEDPAQPKVIKCLIKSVHTKGGGGLA